MASSQVEIASSSPFGYIINRCCTRDSNSYQKNFKNLVQSHLHSCISNQPKKSFSYDSCENSQKTGEFLVHNTEFCGKNQESCCGQVPNVGGVSTLVRKWKDIETESKSLNFVNNSEFVGFQESKNMNLVNNSEFVGVQESKSLNLANDSDFLGFQESKSLNFANNSEFVRFQECDESCSSIVKTESFGDCESDKDSHVKESERLGVADIIKKLKFDNGNVVVAAAVNGGSLSRVRTTMDPSEQQRCNLFSPVVSSPRFIRGRQAFSDLLLQMERDRQRELEGLVECKAVTKFQQRGRIQALLRVRLIRRGAEEVRGVRSVNSSVSESNKSTHSAIMHLREKFNTVGQHGLAVSRNTSKESSMRESGSLPSTPNRQEKENSYRDFKGLISRPQRELARSNSAKAGTGFSLYQQKEDDLLKGLIKERTGLQPCVADSVSTSIALGDKTRDQPRSPHKEVIDNKPKVGNIVISNQLQEENHHEEVPGKVRLSSHQQREGGRHTEQRARMQPSVVDSRSTHTTSVKNTRDPCTSNKENHYEELCKKLSSRKVSNNIQITNSSKNQNEMSYKDLNHEKVSSSLPSCTSQARSFDNLLDFVEIARQNPQSDREEEAANECLVGSESVSLSEYSLTTSGWDELQSNYYQQDNEDWISNVSRPRKEWEGLRQERYQEMLDPYSHNHDIQQLLHRKSVSMFLTSALREKIDRIMASRSQQLQNATSIHVEEQQVSAQVAVDEEEEEQNASEEEEQWGYDNGSEYEKNPSRQRYNGPEVLSHQNTSSQTWNTNPDQEVTDDSYHFPSPSSLQSQSSHSYSQHIRSGSSSAIHPSTEMELIYEMRGHMEQLHQEIFEIRRSMKSCMNMQMTLQRSIKQDVAAAISQLGQKSRGNSDNKGSDKGICCICCEDPVDSLLYRCGHMCTCFKCAHELISGTGKCPICQAPIMDVVRAYTHS